MKQTQHVLGHWLTHRCAVEALKMFAQPGVETFGVVPARATTRRGGDGRRMSRAVAGSSLTLGRGRPTI